MNRAEGGAAPTAREEILARVRAALVDVPGDETPACDHAHPSQAAAAASLVALLAERLADYGAHVTRCGEGDAATAAAVRAACERSGARSLVAAPGLPGGWIPGELADVRILRDDPPLSTAQLDGAGAVLTGCALAIAETGTIALDAGAGQGRRALTLLPDLHVCVVRADQVVATVPQALARLAAAVRDDGRPLTLISGPSATSDIELQRVVGVHGPRRLEVVIDG